MRSERKTFGMILVAYAVGGVLLAGFSAKRIAGQQPEARVEPIRPVVPPIVTPVASVGPIALPEIPPIGVSIPEIGPISLPELNLDIAPMIGETIAPEVAANVKATVNIADDDEFRTTDQETIQKSFAMPAGTQRELEIDDVFGSIEVTADTTDKVEMTVLRTNRAESKEQLEKAKKEVTLDISQDGGALKLYVNGPFRCHCDDCRHSRDDDGYVVKMDFQVHVPRDIEVHVKTVNEGHVRVRGTNGNFSVRNVNGDIEMDNVSGSGTARTVNGPVKVSFRQNPHENSDFKTVNGNVELKFAHDLSADFRFKTFNGGIYSDFPVTALPLHPMEAEHRGAKVIYRADRYTEARVNAGGPQIQVENLNGDIRILENHE